VKEVDRSAVLLESLHQQMSDLLSRLERCYLSFECGRIRLELYDERRLALERGLERLTARMAVVEASCRDAEAEGQAMERLVELLPRLQEFLEETPTEELRPP